MADASRALHAALASALASLLATYIEHSNSLSASQRRAFFSLLLRIPLSLALQAVSSHLSAVLELSLQADVNQGAARRAAPGTHRVSDNEFATQLLRCLDIRLYGEGELQLPGDDEVLIVGQVRTRQILQRCACWQSTIFRHLHTQAWPQLSML